MDRQNPYCYFLLAAFLVLSCSFLGIKAQDSPHSITHIPFPVVSFDYASSTGSVYALVSPESTEYTSSLVELDVYNAEVIRSLQFDHEPREIHLTSSEDFAYISFEDHGYIFRVDLSNMEVDQEIDLSIGQTMYALTFAVPDDSESSLVASLSDNLNNFDYLAMYESGVLLDSSISSYNAFSANSIVINQSGSKLFAYDNSSTGFRSHLVEIHENGLTWKETYQDITAGFRTELKRFGNRVLSSRGHFFSAFTDPPSVKGRFYMESNECQNKSFLISEHSNLAVFLISEHTSVGWKPKLRTFDTTNFERLDPEIPIDLSGSYDKSYDRGLNIIEAKPNLFVMLFGGTFERDKGQLAIMRVNGLAGREELQRSEFSLYPNPSNGFFHVSNPTNQAVDLAIYSAQGALLFEFEYYRNSSIDLNRLPNGYYFIKANDDFIPISITH